MHRKKTLIFCASLLVSVLLLSSCNGNNENTGTESILPESSDTVIIKPESDPEVSEDEISFEMSLSSVPEASEEIQESSVPEPSEEVSEASVSEESAEVSESSVPEPSEEVSESSVPEPSSEVSENSAAEQSKETSENSITEQSGSVSEQSASESSKEASKPPKEESSEPPIIDVTGVRMNAENVTLSVGKKFRLYCTFSPNNATKTDYLWHIAGTNIIDLQPNGTVTGKAVGTATVTAETYNGHKAVCTFTVTEAPPSPEITGEEVPVEWFDDAVFVGDSVTNALYNFSDEGALGDAEFIPSVGIGYHSALWDINAKNNLHPTYYGKKMLMEDAIKASGKSKLFVMMGMNDFSWSIDSTEQCMKEFLQRVEQKCPGIKIYVQSVTPLIASMKRKDALNNTNIAIFNERIKNYCLEQGYVYVDVASAVSDENGNLRDELCYDPKYMGLHPNKAGCRIWIDYLKTHVQ